VNAWPLLAPPPGLHWEHSPPHRQSWFTRNVTRRVWPGRLVLDHDRTLGQWAAAQLDRLRPERVYAFTQVGLESLRWAKSAGVPAVLDNPNGHIRNFANVYRREWARWHGGRYPGHPTSAMIERIELEYALADRIRVSSTWAKESMVRHGVAAEKVFVCAQPIDLTRFVPPVNRAAGVGPLRISFAGILDLRKGFVYLLRAARALGRGRAAIELVGAVGDRASKRILARERIGLDVTVAPGDPVPAHHRAEVFVQPTLEDGFGFAVVEAMACGLPVIITDQCGAAEWVSHRETGWIIPAGDERALTDVLERCLTDRAMLVEMGLRARQAVESHDSQAALRRLESRFSETVCAS
jgi:glycosyltransferase involved in cell wall biosynthesis